MSILAFDLAQGLAVPTHFRFDPDQKSYSDLNLGFYEKKSDFSGFGCPKPKP
jgi:hypothetical protein